jgi:predicted nucleotidyltransferase
VWLGYSGAVEFLRRALEADQRIAYVLLFGSAARGTTHSRSDVDVATGTMSGGLDRAI